MENIFSRLSFLTVACLVAILQFAVLMTFAQHAASGAPFETCPVSILVDETCTTDSPFVTVGEHMQALQGVSLAIMSIVVFLSIVAVAFFVGLSFDQGNSHLIQQRQKENGQFLVKRWQKYRRWSARHYKVFLGDACWARSAAFTC